MRMLSPLCWKFYRMFPNYKIESNHLDYNDEYWPEYCGQKTTMRELEAEGKLETFIKDLVGARQFMKKYQNAFKAFAKFQAPFEETKEMSWDW